MTEEKTPNKPPSSSPDSPAPESQPRSTSAPTDRTGTLHTPNVAKMLQMFGQYLRRRRRKERLTLRGLARRIGMPHTNIYQYERRKKNPRLDELVALSLAFGEKPSRFLRLLEKSCTAPWKYKTRKSKP